jgi:hypothetical protein
LINPRNCPERLSKCKEICITLYKNQNCISIILFDLFILFVNFYPLFIQWSYTQVYILMNFQFSP